MNEMKILKKHFFTYSYSILLLAFITTNTLQAQSLDRNAEHIRNQFPEYYENTIRKYAVDKWRTDHRMIVYEINQQSNSLMSLIRSFESDNTQIAYQAIRKWSRDGYERHNMRIWNDINTFGLEQLIPMHCDWRMVKYEYDRQVKAKNAY